MINIKQNSDCCGCRACEQICPKSCISISIDGCGFHYPTINKEICINCGLCENVCPFINSETNKDAKRRVYAISHKDINIIEQSSSGGAWYGIYEYGIEHGYKIYGVSFDSDFNAVYDSAKTMEECTAFRRSKYVQTNPVGLYKRIKKELDKNERIIFSGTPCYVKGLRNYLRSDYENLILVDLICHGIPSPLVWRKYLDFMEKKYNGRILEINMRDKRYGWNHRLLTSVKIFRKGIICDTSVSNTYMNGFGKELFYRPSCYQCRFATIDRPGDLTIADFWDIEQFTNTFAGLKGVSCCIANTNKGIDVINNIKENYIFEERYLSECLHPNLKHPTRKNPLSEQFWKDWEDCKGNYEFVAKKYLNYNAASRIKRYIKANFPFVNQLKKLVTLS